MKKVKLEDQECFYPAESSYSHVTENPEKHDDYLVRTKEETSEFAHFAHGEWTIMGDNKGVNVEYWMEIPKVETPHHDWSMVIQLVADDLGQMIDNKILWSLRKLFNKPTKK